MNPVRAILFSLAMLAVIGCTAEATLCTEIGAPSGISVEVAGALASTATQANLQVCWDGDCHSTSTELLSFSTTGPQYCTGQKTDDTCTVKQVPTNEMRGFANVDALPTSPVEAVLVLRDDASAQVFHDSIVITPKTTYPNGAQCPAGGVQAALIVDGSQLRQAE